MAENTDPSKMTDEELDAAITGVEPEEPEVVEPEVVDPPDPEPPVVEDPVDEDEPEAPPVPSRREQLRIQDLLAKYKDGPAETPKPKAPNALDYGTALDADPEVIKQLTDDRNATNQAFFDQGLEQAKSIQFHTRLEIDAPRVESKYKFLDKNDEENFNPVAANAMNAKYLQFVGYDAKTGAVQRADIRYSDFVEAEMEFANEVASHSIADTTKNIKKQVAQTGLRPDGSAAKKMNLNKPPDQMTDEELDAIIAQAVPAK